MKTTLWIVLGCVGLAVIGIASVILFVVYGLKEPEDIHVETTVPLEATSEPFEFEVAITNTSKKTQKLDSIDIDQEYLKGISITKSEPIYQESTDIYFSQSYHFTQSLLPGKTLVVTFFAKPLFSGDYAGDLDVCVGTGAHCVTKNIRTVVREIDTTPTRDDSSFVR